MRHSVIRLIILVKHLRLIIWVLCFNSLYVFLLVLFSDFNVPAAGLQIDSNNFTESIVVGREREIKDICYIIVPKFARIC